MLCHPGLLKQVLLNLLLNAADAIEDIAVSRGELGVIRVRSSRRGEDVEISISDTGTGIPPAHRERVFDAFFTTKTPGRGSGQGLAIARAIIEDHHGGKLTFRANPVRGTTFVIRFPLRTPIAEASAR